MINSVVLAGNLTRDAELKQTRTGTNALNFGVAVNERVKNNQTGEWSDRPNFFECVIFGKRAESLSKYLHKGLKVTVSGHLRYNQWENEQGQKRSKIDVVVNDLDFMTPKQDGQQAPQQHQPALTAPAPRPAAAPGVYDEDIPF